MISTLESSGYLTNLILFECMIMKGIAWEIFALVRNQKSLHQTIKMLMKSLHICTFRTLFLYKTLGRKFVPVVFF